MNAMPKVSVIIPAYNAAETLAETLRSVQRQTLADIAVWVINDGSTDDTAIVAESFTRQDGRFHLLNQNNQGPFQSRVNGILASRSKYFAFLDSDDAVEKNAYEMLYDFMEKYRLDAAHCDLSTCRECEDELYLNREAVVENIVIPGIFAGSRVLFAGGAIYRRQICTVSLPPRAYIVCGEDLCLNVYFLREVGRYGWLHKSLYHYRYNLSSVTHAFNRQRLDDFRQVIRVREENAKFYGLDVCDSLFPNWITRNARNMIRQTIRTGGPETVSQIRAYVDLPEVQTAILRANNRERRFVLMAKHHPVLLMWYVKVEYVFVLLYRRIRYAVRKRTENSLPLEI